MIRILNVLLLIALLGSYLKGVSQNLVPNSSFENYTFCPNSTGQLSYTGNWTFVGASTDYYNACSPPGNMSVPLNIYGYQNAYDSNGYIGMIAYAVGDFQQENIYREPAGTYLVQPLVISQRYYLSFKAVLTLNNFESGGACNQLGAKFSTVPYSNSNPIPVNNFAHVFTDSIITDTMNWTTIYGSFIADSAYTFISIGNFFDSLNTQYLDFNGLWYTESSYYYIDDIRLSTDSTFVLHVNNKDDLNLNDFLIYPNPTNSLVHISFDNDEEHTVSIYNLSGQVVLSKIMAKEGALNLNSISPGIYYVKTNNNSYSKKLIIY